MWQMSVKQADVCNLMVVGMTVLINSRVHELSCVRCPCQMMGGLHVMIVLFLFGCCASVGLLCFEFRFSYELKGIKQNHGCTWCAMVFI